MLCGKLCHHSLHGFYIAHIALQVDNARCAFSHALFGPAGTADHVNRCAGLCQHICDLETNAAAAAGDDAGLTLQICHNKSSYQTLTLKPKNSFTLLKQTFSMVFFSSSSPEKYSPRSTRLPR